MNPDNKQPSSQPYVSGPSSMPKTGGEKKVGPIVAALIIVLVLIIAALYVFASKINQPAIPLGNGEPSAAVDAVKPVSGNSTDVKSLEADLDVSTSGLSDQNY